MNAVREYYVLRYVCNMIHSAECRNVLQENITVAIYILAVFTENYSSRNVFEMLLDFGMFR